MQRPAPGLSSSCIITLEENTGFFVKCHCSRFYCRWLKQLFAFLDNHDFLTATSVLFGPIKSNVVKFSHFTVSNPPSARNWHLVNCGLTGPPDVTGHSWHTLCLWSQHCVRLGDSGWPGNKTEECHNLLATVCLSACVWLSSLFSNAR